MTKPTKKPARRKARAPKPVEIDGHLLNPVQYQRYLGHKADRDRTNPKHPEWQRAEYALGDFLADYRPSKKVEGQLRELWRRVDAAKFAIVTMADWPWFCASKTREIGCTTLQRLAGELYFAAHYVKHVTDAIAQENETHLQDWEEADRMLDVLEQNFAGGKVAP